MRLIAGLDRPDKGPIRLDQVVLSDDSRQLRVPLRSRRIGMIFQEDLLFPHLDVFHNVAFGLADQPRPAARARVDEVAELCGISRLLNARWQRFRGASGSESAWRGPWPLVPGCYFATSRSQRLIWSRASCCSSG